MVFLAVLWRQEQVEISRGCVGPAAGEAAREGVAGYLADLLADLPERGKLWRLTKAPQPFGMRWAAWAPFARPVADQLPVVIGLPEAPSGQRCRAEQGGAQVGGAAALKPGVGTAYRCDGMGVAAAGLRPAVVAPVAAHGKLRGADARKTAVERFNTIRLRFRRSGGEAVHNFALDAVPKDAVERMGDDGDAALLMRQFNGVFNAQPWADAFLDEEGEQMPLAGADFFAHNHLKWRALLLGQFAGAQGALDGIVIGDGDDVKVCALTHKSQDVFNASQAVAVAAVHMEIGFSQVADHWHGVFVSL